MADIDDELALFESRRDDLEAHHMGQWVMIHKTEITFFDSFEEAADDATARYGRGPFLIRQIGAPSITLPASVAYFQRA